MKPTVPAPKRRADILPLALDILANFDPRKIEDAAERSGIILARTSGPPGREAGFAHIEIIRQPVFVESLSHPEEPVRVWDGFVREPVRSIVLNTNSGLPECEIFWHEYYHLFYSPHGFQRKMEHHFSTIEALHTQEERRADDFAAAVLIPSLDGCATPGDICERFDVSERLAKRAIRFYSALQNPKNQFAKSDSA